MVAPSIDAIRNSGIQGANQILFGGIRARNRATVNVTIKSGTNRNSSAGPARPLSVKVSPQLQAPKECGIHFREVAMNSVLVKDDNSTTYLVTA